MIVGMWGTRGSLASSGPETAGYGGNTAAVEIVAADGTVLVLDAGTTQLVRRRPGHGGQPHPGRRSRGDSET